MPYGLIGFLARGDQGFDFYFFYGGLYDQKIRKMGAQDGEKQGINEILKKIFRKAKEVKNDYHSRCDKNDQTEYT